MPGPLGPLAATYSIVARCPESGELGVAVQSHYFGVGHVVPWARAGVGAVATQSFVEIGYGPRGLGLMADGVDPETVLTTLRERDPSAALRQVAMVDARGRTALHTGGACIPHAGGLQGEGFSVQGNMLGSDAVWEAMAEAFSDAKGALASRLVDALDAAEAAGGDVRGRKSAALVVVSGERSEEPWIGRLVNVQVDEHADPLPELRRLVDVAAGYRLLQQAQTAVHGGDFEGALRLATEARRLAPTEPDLPFWTGAALASAGRHAEARPLFDQAYGHGEGWRALAARLRERGLLPEPPDGGDD